MPLTGRPMPAHGPTTASSRSSGACASATTQPACSLTRCGTPASVSPSSCRSTPRVAAREDDARGLREVEAEGGGAGGQGRDVASAEHLVEQRPPHGKLLLVGDLLQALHGDEQRRGGLGRALGQRAVEPGALAGQHEPARLVAGAGGERRDDGVPAIGVDRAFDAPPERLERRAAVGDHGRARGIEHGHARVHEARQTLDHGGLGLGVAQRVHHEPLQRGQAAEQRLVGAHDRGVDEPHDLHERGLARDGEDRVAPRLALREQRRPAARRTPARSRTRWRRSRRRRTQRRACGNRRRRSPRAARRR